MTPSPEEIPLSIINEPDPAPIDEEGDELDEEQRATLAAILKQDLPTPEEIERDIKTAAHNAEVQRVREEKLAMRQARRKLKRKKHRR